MELDCVVETQNFINKNRRIKRCSLGTELVNPRSKQTVSGKLRNVFVSCEFNFSPPHG